MPLWVSNVNKAEFSLQKKKVLQCLQFGSINVSRSLSWGYRYNHPPCLWDGGWGIWRLKKNVPCEKFCVSFPLKPSRVSCHCASCVSYSSPSFCITLACISVQQKGQAFQGLPSGEPPDALQLKEHCSSLVCLDLLTASSTIMVPWLSLRRLPGALQRWDQALQSVVTPSSSIEHRVNIQEVTVELSGVGGSLIPFRAWVASRCWRVRSEGRGPGRRPQMSAIRQHARPGVPIVF